mgnify:CR=1 FL=1
MLLHNINSKVKIQKSKEVALNFLNPLNKIEHTSNPSNLSNFLPRSKAAEASSFCLIKKRQKIKRKRSAPRVFSANSLFLIVAFLPHTHSLSHSVALYTGSST